jgi:hypothetical protein
MIGEDEGSTKATGGTARKARGHTTRTEATSSPEATAGSVGPANTDESESTPAEETDAAQSESDIEEAHRLDEVLRATVNLVLRRYLRKVENGKREPAESELGELLARARDQFTCVPTPADTKPGPWTPLIANEGEDDEYSYWGRPVYWLDRQVLEQLSVVVMGTQEWAQASDDVYPEVLVTDSAHRPYTKDWWRLEISTPAKAREIAAALVEAADKAEAVKKALDDQKG